MGEGGYMPVEQIDSTVHSLVQATGGMQAELHALQAQVLRMQYMGIALLVTLCVAVALLLWLFFSQARLRKALHGAEMRLAEALSGVRGRLEMHENRSRQSKPEPDKAHTQRVSRVPRAATVPVFPARREAVQAPKHDELTRGVNELLAGSQPYNFVESLRVLHPQLTLERLTPRSAPDQWTNEAVMERGGDGFFANVAADNASLFPNYDRFSATLDPKPFFEGACHGARIQSVLRPAALKRLEDGTWVVAERGCVQMRHAERQARPAL